ncbi:hypothetical protein F4801DRAFT_568387 [Xylaria longipes]|nr:hypothetical protein F4801DRAFT_568387 [Xylaria longipes]
MENARRRNILKDWFGYAENGDFYLDRHKIFFEWIENDIDFKNDGTDNADALAKLDLATSVVKYMRQHMGETRAQVKAGLQQGAFTGKSDRNQQAAIDRAIRLWLRVNSRDPEDVQDQERSGRWAEGSQLSIFARGIFYPTGAQGDIQKPTDLSEIVGIQSRLTHRLTVANIVKYTEIEVQPAEFLWKHLYYNSNLNVLYVFWEKQWLLDALALTKKQPPQIPIPTQVIEETIESLDYLFPAYEQRTTDYLEKNGINLDDENGCRGVRPALKDFALYNSRLIDIAYEFLNPPRDWRSIWKDRRNPMQFWTFWLGLLIFIITVVLGVVASVLAGLQLGVALYPPSGKANSG